MIYIRVYILVQNTFKIWLGGRARLGSRPGSRGGALIRP